MVPVTDETVVLAPYGMDAEYRPYPPHPTQQKIRDWVRVVREGRQLSAGIPVLYLQHGVDAGGTRGTLTPVLECLLEYPGIRVLIGRKDFNDLRLSILKTFLEIVPHVVIAEHNEQEHRYVLDGASGQGTVFFRELKDVKGLGSQEFAIITVHEAHEIDLFAYRTLKQRCRQSGYPNFVLMEGNPPSEGHWLSRIANPKDADYDPDITVLTLSSYENWNFMAPAYRTSLESMPPAWKRRYLLGETAALPEGTPVYPTFVETVHVHETTIAQDRPIIRGWDWGYRRAACVWAQQEDSGRLLIHREWMALETPEEQFIDGVITRTNLWFGARPCRDFGDPSARNRDPHGVATLQRLSAKGIQLGFRQTTYAQRIPLINRKLSELIGGVPAVTINPGCHVLIEGLAGGYHYPTLKDGAELTAKREVPAQDPWFNHLANSFEYVMVNLYGQSTPAITKTIASRRQRQRRVAARRGVVVF